MCRWTETKFAETMARLDALKNDSPEGSEIYYLINLFEDVTRQVAGELQDLDARLLHLETHLRQTGPTRK